MTLASPVGARRTPIRPLRCQFCRVSRDPNAATRQTLAARSNRLGFSPVGLASLLW
jgi:hypothetical protein